MRRETFTLVTDEADAAEVFEQEHDHPANDHGAIGGGIQYRFTPTSLGSTVVIRCTICKKEQNITDFGNW